MLKINNTSEFDDGISIEKWNWIEYPCEQAEEQWRTKGPTLLRYATGEELKVLMRKRHPLARQKH